MDSILEAHRTEIAVCTAIVLGVAEPITILGERTAYNFYTWHLEKHLIPLQTACQLVLPPIKAFPGEETQGPLSCILVQATVRPQHSNINVPKSYISGREMFTWPACIAAHPQGREPSRKCKQAKIRNPRFENPQILGVKMF